MLGSDATCEDYNLCLLCLGRCPHNLATHVVLLLSDGPSKLGHITGLPCLPAIRLPSALSPFSFSLGDLRHRASSLRQRVSFLSLSSVLMPDLSSRGRTRLLPSSRRQSRPVSVSAHPASRSQTLTITDHPLSVFYQSVLNRLPVAGGVGHYEARRWHRRIYGGLVRVAPHSITTRLTPHRHQVNLAQVLPADLGSAAAYEAYRFWKYHPPLYQHLGGERERQREAMIGMAIGEGGYVPESHALAMLTSPYHAASRLWQYTGRSLDAYGLRAASEAAAATASNIAYRVCITLFLYRLPRVPKHELTFFPHH